MRPTSVVCWKWTTPGYRSTFGPDTVNILRAMVARHYAHPHRFICVTNESSGLDRRVEVVPSWEDFAHVQSPVGRRNPSCYRRLRMFHPQIADVFGDRFVSLDLDVVITGDMTPIWDRAEDIVLWGDTNPKTFYNGSMILMTAGARTRAWTAFDPVRSPQQSRKAGHWGSDQGWISYCLGPTEAKWTMADGVYSYRNHLQPRGGELPANARIVVFHGKVDPWGYPAQHRPWVREHYRADRVAA